MHVQEESRVERKKREARKRILDSAETLFFESKGYEKTTIRDIAEKADVSTGAVYTHFSGKPAILTYLVDRFFADFGELFSKRLRQAKTGIDKVEAFIDMLKEVTAQEKYQAYLHTMIRFEPEDLDDIVIGSIRKNARAFQQVMTEIIEQGQTDGTISMPGDPNIMAFTLMHVVQSVLRDLTGKNLIRYTSTFPDLPLEGIIEALKRLVITALRAKPA